MLNSLVHHQGWWTAGYRCFPAAGAVIRAITVYRWTIIMNKPRICRCTLDVARSTRQITANIDPFSITVPRVAVLGHSCTVRTKPARNNALPRLNVTECTERSICTQRCTSHGVFSRSAAVGPGCVSCTSVHQGNAALTVQNGVRRV